MENISISDIKPFIGAKDYELSKKFYSALGFKTEYESEKISVLEQCGCRFYLQNYYDKSWCDNSMLHINVNNAQAWYEKVQSVLEQGEFGTAKVAPPKQQDYGAIVTFVWDPSGVLLHLAQTSVWK